MDTYPSPPLPLPPVLLTYLIAGETQYREQFWRSVMTASTKKDYKLDYIMNAFMKNNADQAQKNYADQACK